LSQTNANTVELARLVTGATNILVLQPDSPDGDSLGSALGLEEILGDLGKTVHLYAYKEPESYLHDLEGWDRVSQTMPKSFDLTILVDTGSPALIKAALEHHGPQLMTKPFVVIDHHTSRQDFGFKVIEIIDEAVATSELIMQLGLDLVWEVNQRAADKLASALLADSLNLTTSGTTAHSVAMLAEMVQRGANLHDLYRRHREASALSPEQIHLKGQLLSSVEFLCDGRLALAEITPAVVAENIDKFEPYNMIISEMQWAKGVELVAVFKNYGTKINVPMRSVNQYAGPVAEIMGGGGHPNAAAYRAESTNIADEKDKLIKVFIQYAGDRADAAI
jgi:phosphoesterase RecJ-like protein